MSRGRICVAVLVAGAAVLITNGLAAGAAVPKHASHIDLSTRAAVLEYLGSHGIEAKGVVIQRGPRNYAGVHCPGKGWTCTRATRVVQVAKDNGENKFECTASPPTATPSPPNSCMILQSSTAGNNEARCVERSTAADVTQDCDITQNNTTGKNRAFVEQVIKQQDPTSCGADQCATQTAEVKQFNGSGDNELKLRQWVEQSLKTGAVSVSQNQSSDQRYDIQQNCSTSLGLCDTTDANCVGPTGQNKSDADQSVKQEEEASKATTGSQNQDATQADHIGQCSAGVSKNHNGLDEKQKQKAKPGVFQTQSGPQSCCTDQQGNAADKFDVDEHAFQAASNGSGGQFEDQTAECTSAGTCDAKQTIDQNGQHSTNSCTESSCFIFNSCDEGECGGFGDGNGFAHRERLPSILGRILRPVF